MMSDIKYNQSPKKTPKKTKGVQEASAPFKGERKKFATQMNAALLERLRSYAKSEGRQIQAILEDAVEAFLKDKQGYVMDPKVKAAHEHVLKKYDKVFEALAK